MRILTFLVGTSLLLASCANNNSQEKQEAKREQTMSEMGAAEESANKPPSLVPIVSNFISPVCLANAGDGSGRLFVLEQSGKIRIIDKGKLVDKPFLDISQKLIQQNNSYSERGLLGLVFHPDYKKNGKFYVYYSAPSSEKKSDHKSILAEYLVSKSDPNAANTKERVLLEIEEPESNHNGGNLMFGKDGYLYIASGDGGGAGDKHGKNGNAQDLSNLLGKILRIDVNGKQPYGIPSDNPFVNKAKARPEIYAYGLRNPWRFSQDKNSGRIFCGDVGQDTYEETDIIEKGGNYGWRRMEGFHDFDKNLKLADTNFIKPIDEYPHSLGISICGGYVYNGNKIPFLSGKYVFADWTGKLFTLTEQGGKWTREELKPAGFREGLRINSFGEDEEGNLYVLAQDQIGPNSNTGIIYKFEK